MNENDRKRQREQHVTWLVAKTGITAAQAGELIDLIGTGSLTSLVREALFLLKK